jgi:hypothetical protein
VVNRRALGASFQFWNGPSSPAVILLGQETASPYRIGFSECYVHVDLASVIVAGLLPANAHWELGVPLERGLIGRSLAFRGVVPEPLGSYPGVVVTNGVAVRFGW